VNWFHGIDVDKIDVEWAIGEVEEFLSMVNAISVDDKRCYSASYEEAHKKWYTFLHDRLHKYGFANGEPDKNTFEKNPKAAFWWQIFMMNPYYYGPNYDHHGSSREAVLNMKTMLEDLIGFLRS
jgi:hypothetical protein